MPLARPPPGADQAQTTATPNQTPRPVIFGWTALDLHCFGGVGPGQFHLEDFNYYLSVLTRPLRQSCPERPLATPSRTSCGNEYMVFIYARDVSDILPGVAASDQNAFDTSPPTTAGGLSREVGSNTLPSPGLGRGRGCLLSTRSGFNGVFMSRQGKRPGIHDQVLQRRRPIQVTSGATIQGISRGRYPIPFRSRPSAIPTTTPRRTPG